MLVCGSFAKKFFQQQFTMVDDSTASNPCKMIIGGKERTVFWIHHSEYLIRYASQHERRAAAQTLQRFAKATKQRMDTDWFKERGSRPPDDERSEPDTESPTQGEVRASGKALARGHKNHTDRSHWKSDWLKGYKALTNQELREASAAFGRTRFDKNTPEVAALRECCSLASRRWWD